MHRSTTDRSPGAKFLFFFCTRGWERTKAVPSGKKKFCGAACQLSIDFGIK